MTADSARLRATADFVREHDTATLLPLFAEAGLRLPDPTPLPLSAAVPHARKATVPTPAGPPPAPVLPQDGRDGCRPGRPGST
ncbi:hypothetical protein [Kitasatospora sp. NPDC017646]|uniref:hypothetical protein n=1 Tax=Kitasatospora sp. NPDC017646 TaxID=3364024 RepID=UPI0037BB67A4